MQQFHERTDDMSQVSQLLRPLHGELRFCRQNKTKQSNNPGLRVYVPPAAHGKHERDAGEMLVVNLTNLSSHGLPLGRLDSF